ncbi:MAG: hypothetical protein K9J85_04645, partial [Desulfobacteraceae bacterium]|nr:hypothetical protein [Desulfobacteraceae bacterium]
AFAKISKTRPCGLKQFEIFTLRHLLNFPENAQCRFKNCPRPWVSLEVQDQGLRNFEECNSRLQRDEIPRDEAQRRYWTFYFAVKYKEKSKEVNNGPIDHKPPGYRFCTV